MESYLAIKKKEIMEFTGKWMEMEKNYTEVTLAHKDKGPLYHLNPRF